MPENKKQSDPSTNQLVLSRTVFFSWLRRAINHALEHKVEDPWYTVWNIVFLAIALASKPANKLSGPTLVAPQLAVVRRFSRKMGSNLNEYIQRVIPDFLLAWYWNQKDGPVRWKRGIDLIVEIKPYNFNVKNRTDDEAARATIVGSLGQVKLQVRHAFDESPAQSHIWALVICGLHWMIFKFERGEMSPESKKKGPQTRSQTNLAAQAAEAQQVDQVAGQFLLEVAEIEAAYLPEATYTKVLASDMHMLVDNLRTGNLSLSNAFRIMVDVVWKDDETNMTTSQPAWFAPDPDEQDPDNSIARNKLLNVWSDDVDVEPSGHIMEINETSPIARRISDAGFLQPEAGQSNTASPSPFSKKVKRNLFDFVLTEDHEAVEPNESQSPAMPVMGSFSFTSATMASSSSNAGANAARVTELLKQNEMLIAEVNKLRAQLKKTGLVLDDADVRSAENAHVMDSDAGWESSTNLTLSGAESRPL